MNNFDQSRREFLSFLGKGAMGAAAMTAVPAMMTSAVAEGAEAPAWPWEWHPIDKDKVKAHTYDIFHTHGGCCAAVVGGILELLAEEYGYPYNQLNARMFANGGGGYGAKTLCGSLGGACAVLGLFCEAPRAGALRNEVYAWYKEHEFPQYAPEFSSPLTVSNSIQCADSVGNWMKATGFEFGSPERIARCAGVSAEVAAKVVELLNIEYGYEAAPEAPAAEEAPALAANEFIGEADGFGGKVKVKVTMDGAKIAKIDVLENSETPEIGGKAFEPIIEKIIANQDANVDAVANATVTSNAIMDAVKNALSKID